MEGLLSMDELSIITLKSPFVYEFGDTPYFKKCINEFPHHFFVRYRANKNDPTQHTWSRLLEVVDRQHGESPTGTARATTAALKWKEKHFFISLRVEGEEKSVELPRLSSKLPNHDEVMAYCARRAEKELRAAAPADVSGTAARDQLPSAAEISKMRTFRQQRIVHHRWTPSELEESQEQNMRLDRAGAGSAPVRLTVTSLHNMRLETELGIASSRHAIGHTALAMDRRPGDNLSLAGTQQSASTVNLNRVASESPAMSPVPMGISRAVLESPQPRDLSQPVSLWNSGASLAELVAPMGPPTQMSQSPVSQEAIRLWEESKQDAERFFAYVSEEKRSAYMKKIAGITLKNYERNKRDRLRGIENEKRLDRKGNLLESGGLWIMDDQARAQLALKYQVEQDDETAVGRGGKKPGGKPTDDSAGKPTGNAEAPVSEEEAMVTRFLQQRSSQELSFADVPDDFLEVSTRADTPIGSEGETEGSRVLSAARSPELLVMGGGPRRVVAQLLHHTASSVAKRSRRQEEVLGEEPPLKAMR